MARNWMASGEGTSQSEAEENLRTNVSQVNPLFEKHSIGDISTTENPPGHFKASAMVTSNLKT